MRVLGLEGTAWNASASVYDAERDEVLSLESDPYEPDSGGIHPREASEHIADAIVPAMERALDAAADGDGRPGDAGAAVDDAGSRAAGEPPVDAVAFSRGPGLGPCLRAVAACARAAALGWDVPLVGVNHTVAHVEMGRWSSGFDDPVALDAAGANTLVAAYRGDRYRVLGETLDTGVGNALDKLARHADLSHPGGPKLEELAAEATPEGPAEDDDLLDLPYTVKGMDFAFSGVVTAAQSHLDDGAALPDVAHSFQEHVFAALTEVAERALALTRNDALVVGGGVAANERLRGMLEAMCEDRGARFHSPPLEYLGDNSAMIAVTGAKMAEAGDTVAVEESTVRPDWRPDDDAVAWREDRPATPTADGELVQGAEAAVSFEGDVVRKRRAPKRYRHPALDATLRRRRTASEARLTAKARRTGTATPAVLDVDRRETTLTLQLVGADGEPSPDLTAVLDADSEPTVEPGTVGAAVADALEGLHAAGIAHGDPTVRNLLWRDGRLWLIDFGLAYETRDVEDFGMDVHVVRQSLAGTADAPDAVMDGFWDGYDWERADLVEERAAAIAGRGRGR